MQETPITHPGIPQEVYHTMGKKTFWIFLLQRVHAAFVLLLLTIVLFAVSGQPFLVSTPIGNLAPYMSLGAWLGLLLFVLVGGVTFLISWLIYKNYKYCLGEDSLKIKRGILNKEEVSIPYRQIQDVDIRRDLAFQMIGLSEIVILTAGHEEGEHPGDDDSEGMLPALDKDLAEWLQAQLLERANVQKVTEEPASAVIPPSSPPSA
ncbi:MAG TPA: PH domain-containing protein [Candidatus Paceibacterota bacterium]|nr:PH domain-containing protein [Candidatus Paceibacterota bacterium]